MFMKLFAADGTIGGDATKCGGVETFFDYGCGKSKSTNQIEHLFGWIFNLFSAGVVMAIIAVIIIAGIQYSASGGNQEMAKKAMNRIKNAAIALVLYLCLWSIMIFLGVANVL